AGELGRDDAAGLSQEGTEQLGMATGGVAWRWAPLLAAVAVAVAWRGGYTDDARGVVAALAGLTALTAAWTTGAPSDAARDAVAILALCALVVAAASVPGPLGHAGVLLVAALASAISGLAATIAL